MTIVHHSEPEVNMRDLCGKNRDGKVFLYRVKYREVGTGLMERAASDAKGFTAPETIEPNVVDEALQIVGIFALVALDDQLKADVGIDVDQLDVTQAKQLLWFYVEAFAREVQR